MDSQATDADSQQIDDLMKADDFVEGGAEPVDDDPAEDIMNMYQLLIDERCAPDILPYCPDLVEDLKAQLENQKAEVQNMRQEGKEIHAHMYEMELQRIEFMLNSYHRCRVGKLFKFKLCFISQSDKYRTLLSAHEFALLQKFVDDWGSHMAHEVTEYLPRQFQELNTVKADYGVDMVARPPEHEHVFFKAESSLGQIRIGKTVDEFEVNEGDVLCVPFNSIRRYLKAETPEGSLVGGSLL